MLGFQPIFIVIGGENRAQQANQNRACCGLCQMTDKILTVLRVIVYVGFVINTVLAIRNGFSVMYWVNAVLAALIAGFHIAEIRGRKKS